MKMIPKLRKHNYLARIGVFLIAIALIAGTVSCKDDGVVRYTLTMAENLPAGGTATDLTGGSPYAANTSVNIQASANPGYLFTKWGAPAGAFGNAAAATTTFTMPAQNVIVTANFVSTLSMILDHFTGYDAVSTTEWLNITDVYLEDQFGNWTATILEPRAFFNPAEKQHEGHVTPILNTTHHFTVYDITYGEMPQNRTVEVYNQFGRQKLTVGAPVALAVPTQKEGHAAPVGLDHYLLYEVVRGGLGSMAYDLNLTDQFGRVRWLMEVLPWLFANPVKKTYKGNVTDIVNPDVHGVIYEFIGSGWNETQISVDNQFGNQTLNVTGPYCMFVPSAKVVPPPLDHFKCYNVTDASAVGEWVDLTDQFTEYLGLMVMEAKWFCNPVDKNGEGMTNPDNHLTVYNLIVGDPGDLNYWYVEVDNQFGLQNLTVFGPSRLAVPTWKWYPGEHGPPKYLDHYLLYDIVYGSPVNEPVNELVDLDDEFELTAPGVNVTMPRFFANPVLYKYHDGKETWEWNPEAHLVFYEISDNPEFSTWVGGNNQFEDQIFVLNETGQLLAVPSEKLYYEYGLP